MGSCSSCEPLRPEQLLEHLQSLRWYQGQVVHVQRTPARLPRHLAPSLPLAPSTRAALAARGIQQLFVHQAAAVDALCCQRKHVVVATSTASGKSLCYNVPMLEALAADRDACCLLLFPTKALAQDQLRVLRQLMADAFGADAPCVEVYDGDTPHPQRAAIRDRAQLLITNPDMLHQSILPFHSNFSRLLAKLAYVVVDEGHAYRGVFGCHAALVLRRLRRLCSRAYASSPLFVVTSATIANPLEHAALLLGVGPEALLLVDEDGSPHGSKEFVLWNPPLTAQAQQAVGEGGGGVFLSRTEQRVGGVAASGAAAAAPAAALSPKMQREMARTLARESNAARRRGVALNAAAGVTEEEWAAAVRLGHASAAARALLFDRKRQHKPSKVLAAAAATGAAEAVAGEQRQEHDAMQLDEQQQQQQQEQQEVLDEEADVRVVGEVAAAAAAAAAANSQHEQHLVTADDDVVMADVFEPAIANGQPPPLPQQQQQQQLEKGAGRAPAAGKLSRKTRQVASEALAAVQAAAETFSMQKGRGSRVMKRRPAHGVIQPSAAAQPSNRNTPSSMPAAAPPGSSSRPAASTTAAVAGTASALQSDLQRQIEAALPPRGQFKELYGAAGTPLDQRRESPIVEMSLLLAEAVMHGLRTIAFCKSRKLCELISAYTRENLKACAPHKAGLVKVYRAGYSPAERRQLEADLHSGALTAVAATNALELGIDVGSLDLTLHLGFPGSVASLWQQAGRAGRRSQASASLYVAFDGPLDQHFMTHPHALFARPIECVQLDPCNAIVLNSHLVCAAKELPLLPSEDGPLFGETQLQAALQQLKSAALLGRHPRDPPHSEALHYTGRAQNPAADVSLRTIDPERFVIWNAADASVLEEIEANMAFYEIYDGAIYMYQGRTYICTSLSLETRVAQVKPIDVRWYTRVRDHTDIHVTGAHVAYPTAHAALAAIAARRATTGADTRQAAVKQEAAAAAAAVVVSAEAAAAQQQVKPEEAAAAAGAAAAGAERPGFDSQLAGQQGRCQVHVKSEDGVHQGSGQVFDAIDLFLPDTQFETQACYMRLPPSARRACDAAGIPFREAVHAASHALLNVLPLYMVCNSTDMGTECDNPYDTRFRPERLLLYDKHPGGIGLAAQATPLFPELLQQALELVQRCACRYVKGCPCCVQHLDCKNYNAVLNKAGAVLVLEAALEQEAAVAEARAGQR
ncbi:hypothetical protein OEZ86_003020 [Tetradesmus obliquus]|nr:hypothetical protein OEZ86_003020 [Tetradesmus obliquus]